MGTRKCYLELKDFFHSIMINFYFIITLDTVADENFVWNEQEKKSIIFDLWLWNLQFQKLTFLKTCWYELTVVSFETAVWQEKELIMFEVQGFFGCILYWKRNHMSLIHFIAFILTFSCSLDLAAVWEERILISDEAQGFFWCIL